ncbi:MAG: glycosyltransferase family 39 protein [Candidatus Daviesbacteria bacterium]|nr:glycosyltransferase family 39 protein [Candidatus Daviesbacteria bacterium]
MIKTLKVHIAVKALLYWYIFIFISTEALSYLHLLERNYILTAEIFFWVVFLFFNHQEIRRKIQVIDIRSKSILFILALFGLTFIQGFFSAPSTTDSMVYHIPRVMYWMQEKTLFQDVIRNSHDYMAPFGEYILLHLYLIFDNDRMLFFSQWIAYVVSVVLIGIIASQFGADQKTKQLVRLFTATLPIAVMQASSTQVDMVVTVLVLLSLYLSMLLRQFYAIKHSILLGFVIGLGFLTKATFVFYVLIPIGLLFFSLWRQFKKLILIILPILLLTIILQFRFLSQNLLLYGNFLGVKVSEKGEEAVYINEVINPSSVLSNLVRNFLVHLPIPIFSSYIQNTVVQLHNLIGFDINDPRITCCGTEFSVKSILYPQEDIVANPIHLIIIISGGFLFFYKRKQLHINPQIKILYLLTIASLILFSAFIKWQPFHPRLEIPFFMVGTMSAIIIISNAKKIKLLYIGLILSSVIVLIVVFLNVSRPYISYNVFYNMVKALKPPLASVPEAFYVKPRQQQYFNARYYWYEPYGKIIDLLKKENNIELAFNLGDGFEYPLWTLFRKYKLNYQVVPMSKLSKNTIIISTSKDPYKREGYLTECIKTEIDYGYACLTIAN